MRKCARDFEGVKRAADDFVEWANGILEKLQDSDAEVQTALPEKRIRKHKRQPGELAQDEPIANADIDYKINIHNVILDTVMQKMQCCVQMSPAWILGISLKSEKKAFQGQP